jgi:hypothetical protein
MRFPALFAILGFTSIWTEGCRQDRTALGPSRDAANGDAPPLVETKAARGTAIAILYSSNLQGEYEHCGCPSHPLGGLVRRATVADQARADSDGVLIVDAGDMLLPATFHQTTLRPPDPSEVQRRARLILTAYARMGIHAVLPAERDLALGPGKLKRLLTSLGIPAVASNLFDHAGHPVFDRDRIVTIAGIPVGVFGVVRTLPEDETEWQGWRLHVTDPVAAAREEVASLKARGAKMIVALLHLGPAGAAQQLLAQVPGITWAVQGHAGAQLETPISVGGAQLVEAMAMGKLSGRLDIHVVNGTASFSDRGERAQVMTIIDDHRRQLADIERRAAEDKTDQLRDYYRLRREGIGAAIARETALARTLPAVVEGSWYENRIIPLDESIPDQRAIALLVTAYNTESARRATSGLPVGIAMRNPAVSVGQSPQAGLTLGATSDQPTRYAGSAACAGCHEAAWRVFETTKHAHALAALRPTKRDRDPTCVGCHSTGYLLPGGTLSIRVATDQLRDVGCESCHGPSLDHIVAANKTATTHRKVDETVCRGCHTPDQTNGEFEYKAFVKAVVGPGHGA